MPTVVIGTAGHIDHGKTSLLRALTGIDADRLPEERERGMTIDVGYAHLAFDDGVELDFVDVPGHDRLVGNMLVGAGEIDAAMLVVAADDGPRPQTIEHLALLDALAIRDGLAVVTKIDLVPEARLAEVIGETVALLERTGLGGVPVLAVSSTTAAGIEALREALRGLRDRVAASPVGWPSPARLAVDRVFSARGRGLVVTGTLRGARLAAGDEVRLEPAGHVARVREVQVHGARRADADGGRTAVNLAGVTASQVRRGNVLVPLPGRDKARGPAWPAIQPTSQLLVEISPPSAIADATSWPPRDATQLRLHLGTAAVDATVRRRGREGTPLANGRATARLALAEPVATFAGERAVLRQAASGDLAGGVRVLDPDPPRGASRRRVTPPRLDALVAALDRDPAAARAAMLDLHGALPDGGTIEFSGDIGDALRDRAVALVTATVEADPLSRGLALPEARTQLARTLRTLAEIRRSWARAASVALDDHIATLVASGEIARHGDRLLPPGTGAGAPDGLAAAMDRLEAALGVNSPPGLAGAAAAAGCPPDGIGALQAAGRIVRLEADLAWATPTFHRLAALALDMARREPLTPAAFRDATGSSRRYVLAILEDLDRRGILVRQADGHVPGPRAPAA